MKPWMIAGLVGGSLVVMAALLFVVPWRLVDWGKVSVKPARMVTVTGQAKQQQQNQVATFNAGVNAVADNKETAVKEVNDKITALIESIKQFGIAADDIKTQNMNIYQNQEPYYEGGRQKQRFGQWSVSNTVEITLREIARAQELTSLLSESGANNVYGPNFSLEDNQGAEAELLNQAIANAREKASSMAVAAGARLGSIIQVQEGGSSSPVVPMYDRGMGGGGGTPVEPGSTTVTKTVTVTFELR